MKRHASPLGDKPPAGADHDVSRRHIPASPSRSFSSGLISSLFLATILALIDFIFLELRFSASNFTTFVLFKPGFLALNLVTSQLITFSLVSIPVFTASFVVARMIGSRPLIGRFIRPVFLTTATLSGVVIGLRLYKYSGSAASTAIVFVSALTLTVISFLRDRLPRTSRNPGEFGSSGSSWRLTVNICLILAASFFVPDFYYILARPNRLTSTGSHADSGPNIVLVVLDTVRADHVAPAESGFSTTPRLRQICDQGIVFLRAYSTAPWTVPSHAAMFTGLPTSRHGADWGHQYLRDDFTTIAEVLRLRGYETVALSENPFIGPAHGFGQGFADFFETWRQPMLTRAIREAAVRIGIYRSDREYASRTLALFRRWLDLHGGLDRPFFAYINLMAAHLPRYPRPEPDSLLFSDRMLRRIEPVNLVPERFYLPTYNLDRDHLELMRAIYEQQIEYLDGQIKILMNDISMRNLVDSSVFFITSDHGEHFGEHGYIEHQFSLNNSLIHVPLVIWNPNLIKQTSIHEPTSTSIIFQSILEFSSREIFTKNELPYDYTPLVYSSKNNAIEDPIISEYTRGFHMFLATLGDDYEIIDRQKFDRDIKSIIKGNFKYIWYSDGTRELYDISNDPGENYNLFTARERLASELHETLFRSLSGSAALPEASTRPEVDPAVQDELRALGYVD